ncbi:MAG: hypothetical protein ACYCT7_06730 [bacterium]
MIKKIISDYLPIIGEEQTLANLGNRSLYVGASTVTSCALKAVLDMVVEKETYTPEKLIVFERGHIGEEIVRKPLLKAVGNDIKNVIYQYEVSTDNGHIKAHPDFIIETLGGKTLVVECKTSEPTESVRESYALQNIFQMGLLLLENPKLQGKISGEVIVINLKNGEHEEYEIKYNPEMFNMLLDKARLIWDTVSQYPDVSLDNIETEASVLCGWCDHRLSCPSYTSSKTNLPDDVKSLIKQYIELNSVSKDIKKQQDTLKEQITGFGNFKTVFDGIKASVSTSEYNSIDATMLKSLYPEILPDLEKKIKTTRFLCSYL